MIDCDYCCTDLHTAAGYALCAPPTVTHITVPAGPLNAGYRPLLS